MAGSGHRLVDRTAMPFGAWLSRVGDFVQLMKPRPMAVVVFTALAGLIAAPNSVALDAGIVSMLCIALGGGGSAALNMWFERDIDARMVRTANRPIVAGRIAAGEALTFAMLAMMTSVVVMTVAVNPVAGLLLALTIMFYGVIYTMWLKRVTALNVVIGGGLASLLTPLTGYAAAAGEVTIEAVALFAFLVPWTAPHVWSQALVRASDYAQAGVPMMPVVAGSARTRQLIVAFTVCHAIMALLPFALGTTSMLWGAVAAIGGAVMVAKSVTLMRIADSAMERREAWTFYRMNSFYVVALLAALIVERAMGFGGAATLVAGVAG